MPVSPRTGLLGAVRGALQRNQDLLRNASGLAATTGLNSLFGFVYWFVAARVYTKEEVGYGAAAVSAMLLLGTVGEFGLGTMLIGELPKRRSRGGLTIACIIVSGLGSLVLGLGFPVVADAFGASFPQIGGTPGRVALFAVGVALVGMTVVFDDATLGLLRSGVQLTRNLAMSAVKLALLPVAVVILHDAFGVGLIFAWVAGMLLSLVPALVLLRRGGSRILHRPDWALLRRLGGLAMTHNWLNLAIMTTPKLMPVLVTIVVSPSANASFYVAWMLVNFLFMVPASLSVILFAIASASPDVVAQKLRFTLRLSLMIGLPAMAVLAVCSRLLLEIFGQSYVQQASIPLLLLILTYLPTLPKIQYIAVCRASHRVRQAAIVLSIAALCDAAAAVVGGKLDGLNGVAAGYLIMQVIEGVATAPTVLRAAAVKTRAATGEFPALASTTAQPILEHNYIDRQRISLSALIALASLAISESGSTLDVATEVWRTGSFPAVTGSIRIATGSFPKLPGEDEEGYGIRQRAGVDALLSIATPLEENGTDGDRPTASAKQRNHRRQ
ncbi:lipopolysaccharide biosynthesis protein [Trebonia kvetii]|nr:lipopolysaccharide biosynthesis protein [Trebonia kvetii]